MNNEQFKAAMAIPLTLEDMGCTEELKANAAAYIAEHNAHAARDLRLGRVVSEHKERYRVRATDGEYDAEITGNLRYTALDKEDFPSVGDWVLMAAVDDGFAVIHALMPRHSVIRRKAPDRDGEVQIIAANIDYALILQAADRDFNLNRIERYLSICADSRIQSIIVITKADLCDLARMEDLLEQVRTRVGPIPVLALSNISLAGLDTLREHILKGKTYCLLGSSGVGKSTLLNALSGRGVMKTGETSESTRKGRHTTSHRELVILDSGGILIDNPGMREVGMTDDESAIDRAFPAISALSRSCRFSDCTHVHESGCAVLASLQSGELDRELYENFLRMERENRHFASTANERHKKDRDFGKMIKAYKKDRREGKF